MSGVCKLNREDALKRELADITRRSQAAEARHEELATALPEATRPLLRQIEAMQAANAANAQAWAAAERSLHDRLSAAEAHAAACGAQPILHLRNLIGHEKGSKHASTPTPVKRVLIAPQLAMKWLLAYVPG